MMKNYKKLAILVAIMILTLSITSTGFAADTVANLKAYYKNIKIMRNGTQVQMAAEPFIVDGATYVPLRAIAELFDKEVTFDGVNYKININDKPGQNINEMYAQILSQQQTIAQLQAKIKTLETNGSGSKIDLDDLEDDLNDDYDDIEGIKVVEIKLDGDKDDIEVEVYIDDSKNKWNTITDSEIEDFLQDIVDDILKVYKNADIEGFIEDDDSGDELVSFTISTKDKVVLGSGSLSKYDIDDLEDYLNDEYKKSNGVNFEIKLDGDEDELEVVVIADVDDIYDYLDEDELEDLLYDIYDDIVDTDEFEDADIYGYVEDDIDEIDFSFTSNGTLDLKW